ncbi:hypothetical protein AVEN_182922-1 [Araneus ventricosus]|uniref:Uncharacterized protein n=1 Tax=Araneus ventricosus TaxID=182803 RepID=A0A4Y2T0I1_ARAVE|nr:hypothetical protein AVEN_182922-1 [Araneus ventricosus]
MSSSKPLPDNYQTSGRSASTSLSRQAVLVWHFRSCGASSRFHVRMCSVPCGKSQEPAACKEESNFNHSINFSIPKGLKRPFNQRTTCARSTPNIPAEFPPSSSLM